MRRPFVAGFRHVVFVASVVAQPLAAQGTQTVTITQPPATLGGGGGFAVTETVWNGGTSAGGGGTQTISLVPAGGGAAIALATRSIPSLAPGAHSTVTTTVTIPLTMAAGSYQLGAGAAGCASSCLKSTGMMAVTAGQQSHVLSLVLNASGPGLGAIDVKNAASGAQITNCQGVCGIPIAAGTTITVSYAGPLSANFQGWNAVGCSGVAPCTFVMSGPKSVSATVSAAGGGSPVTVTVFVNGAGSVSGGREVAYFQNQYFQNCTMAGPPGCVTSGPSGTAFLLAATTAMKPPSGAFGSSQMSTFVGWQGQGCTGQVQGNQLRVVPGASITCVAKFQ